MKSIIVFSSAFRPIIWLSPFKENIPSNLLNNILESIGYFSFKTIRSVVEFSIGFLEGALFI
jgi:hypothetical protein